MSQKFGLWILMAVLALPAAVFAHSLDRKRGKHYPESTRYWWGFFISLDVAFLGAFVLVNAITNALAGRYVSLWWKLAFGSAYLAAGWLGVRRTRVGLVASTLLTLNPLCYLVSVFYLRQRWREMGNPTAVTVTGGRRRERIYRNMY